MNIAEFFFNFQQPIQICFDNTVCHLSDKEIVPGGKILVKLPCIDIRLIELDYFPTVDFCLAGWNINKKSTFADDKILGIHYPGGNQKAISNGTLTSEKSSCWKVGWDTPSVTEKGSSGSPIFSNSQVIGVLSEGDADCDHLKEKDTYGKLSKSWKKIGNWLDPAGNGTKSLNGSTQ